MGNILRTLQAGLVGKTLSPVGDNRGWFPLIRESFPGAWQRNVTVNAESVMAFHAVYACATLIAGDIAKLRPRLVKLDSHGIWTETTDKERSPLLAKPNHYQTRNQFIESWALSRLFRGNAYVLVQRNAMRITGLYVLDPNRVKPLVAPDGSIFYELQADNLSGLEEERVVVPARYMIHDRANCLFHPLVGTSPIFACGLAATQGLAIQTNSTKFFNNASRPGGILTAPGRIDAENATRLKEHWETNFGGDQMGKLAVLGDGLKFESLSITADEAQLIEQMKWTAEVVCSVFHVPPHMAGVGPVPALGNVEALAQLYYSQALQSPIEAMESCLDEGLGLGEKMGVEFDLSGLLRMDTATRIKALSDAVGGTIMTPNEARRQLDLPPVDGGDACYAQQQDFSLSALAERDRNKPFAKPGNPAGAVGA